MLKQVYAYGTRRRETSMLDLQDLRHNPRAKGYGRFGALEVRFGKASRGSPPKRRTVLTVPEVDWIVPDTDLPLDVHAAGSFLLLFGQHLARVTALPTAALSAVDGHTVLVLDRTPTRLPEPLARLLAELADQPPPSGWAANSPHRWLFPGTRPARLRCRSRPAFGRPPHPHPAGPHHRVGPARPGPAARCPRPHARPTRHHRPAVAPTRRHRLECLPRSPPDRNTRLINDGAGQPRATGTPLSR